MKYQSNDVALKELLEVFENSNDVIISENKELNFIIIFQEHMTDIMTFNNDLLPQLRKNKDKNVDEVLTGLARKIDINEKDPYQIIFQGLMLYYQNKQFYILDISKVLRRSTGDSNVEPINIVGARDGFTENFKDNISLLRTRIKNAELNIEEYMVGRRSKTWVGLLSIKDIHNEEKRRLLIKKLNEIDIDALITVSDIIPWLTKRTIFPVCNYIGVPDLAATKLLDGEFLILIDRIPLAIATPTSFYDLVEERVDFNENTPIRFLHRLLILFCFFLSTVFLGLLLSFLTYQKDLLSLPLISTLQVTQKGAIFPIAAEILFVLFLFELYHFITFRSSEKTLGSTIVLIAGLIIGQNIIESGLVGVVVITATALAFMSGFVVSNNLHFQFGLSIIRIIFIVASFFFGLYGVSLAMIIISIYFMKQSFLGEHFFYPFIPFDYEGFKQFFTARNKRKKRNLSLDVKNFRRMNNDKKNN